MKTTRFFIIAAIVGSMLAGCKKDKDDKNAYTYDGKIFKIAWVGYFYDDDAKGYFFAISHTIPAGELYYEDNQFVVGYPEAKLGVKCDLSQDCSTNWCLGGYFKNSGYPYYFRDESGKCYENNPNDLSGKDNWVKVTKKPSGEHAFDLEFAMTINGKRLTGNYTGKFKKYENYVDVGLIL